MLVRAMEEALMPIKTHKPGGAPPTYSICLYGRGGVGKTTMLSTMEGKGLVIDVPQSEGGADMVLEEWGDRIDITYIEKWADLEPVRLRLIREPHDYKWIAIDSLTALNNLARRKVINEEARPLNVNPHDMQLKEWGIMAREVAEIVFQFQKIRGVHKVYIAQERTHGYGDEPKRIGPDIQPETLRHLIGPLTLMGHLSLAQNSDSEWERTLRIGPDEGYFTKYRAKYGVDVPFVIRRPKFQIGSNRPILPYLFGKSARRPLELKEDFITLG